MKLKKTRTNRSHGKETSLYTKNNRENLGMKVNNQMCVSERSPSLFCKENNNNETRLEAGKQRAVGIILEIMVV